MSPGRRARGHIGAASRRCRAVKLRRRSSRHRAFHEARHVRQPFDNMLDLASQQEERAISRQHLFSDGVVSPPHYMIHTMPLGAARAHTLVPPMFDAFHSFLQRAAYAPRSPPR